MARRETGRFQDEFDPRTRKVDPYSIEAWANPDQIPNITAKVKRIEAMGNIPLNPFWVFDELNFGIIPLNNRQRFIEMLDSTPFAKDIDFVHTKKGVRVKASKIRPLLAAFDYLPPELFVEIGFVENNNEEPNLETALRH